MRKPNPPRIVSPDDAAVDRAALTPRYSMRTAVFLDGTIELLGKVTKRPGATYDRLQVELLVLETEFRGWAHREPDAERRRTMAESLTGVLERVHGLARGERCLEVTIELLAQMRARPGLTYEKMKDELLELGEELRTWADHEPTHESRLATLAAFGDLEDQVQSLAGGGR
jgi:hypothetical protein